MVNAQFSVSAPRHAFLVDLRRLVAFFAVFWLLLVAAFAVNGTMGRLEDRLGTSDHGVTPLESVWEAVWRGFGLLAWRQVPESYCGGNGDPAAMIPPSANLSVPPPSSLRWTVQPESLRYFLAGGDVACHSSVPAGPSTILGAAGFASTAWNGDQPNHASRLFLQRALVDGDEPGHVVDDSAGKRARGGRADNGVLSD
jgi:hypothetical protein